MTITVQIQRAPWFRKISALRALNSWSQEEAADRCGTCKRIYWNWENGEHFPSKGNRRLIAKAFDVPEEEIFSEV